MEIVTIRDGVTLKPKIGITINRHDLATFEAIMIEQKRDDIIVEPINAKQVEGLIETVDTLLKQSMGEQVWKDMVGKEAQKHTIDKMLGE